MISDPVGIGWSGRPENFGWSHPMSINDLVLRSIYDRIRDITGAAKEIGGQEHYGGRRQIPLTGSYQTIIVQVAESETGVSRKLTGIEKAEAINSNGSSLVALKEVQHCQLPSPGFFYFFLKWLYHFFCIFYPETGSFFSLVLICSLISFVSFS
jgi:hypothetical protein